MKPGVRKLPFALLLGSLLPGSAFCDSLLRMRLRRRNPEALDFSPMDPGRRISDSRYGFQGLRERWVCIHKNAIIEGMFHIEPTRQAEQAVPAAIGQAYSRIGCRSIRLQWMIFLQSVGLLVFSAGCSSPPPPLPEEILRDDFSEKREALWEMVSGEWAWQEGFVSQQTEGRLESALLFEDAPAPDYRVRIRLRIRAGETYRSAGLVFDYLDPQNRRAVYLTNVGEQTEPFGPKIQITSRFDGRDRYPPEARTKYRVQLNRWYSLEMRIRDRDVEIWVDGSRELRYTLQGDRNHGRIGLFTFDANADFRDFLLESH